MASVTTTLHSPLTTTFTPPATCTDSFADDGIWPDSTSGSQRILQASYPQDSACFASGWTTASNVYAKGANFWSGSPICPHNQTVAQTSSSSTWTTAVCCSSGWGDVYTNGNPDGNTVYTFYICRSTWNAPATTTLYGHVAAGGVVVPSTTTVTAPAALESTAEYLFVYDRLATPTSSASPATTTDPTGAQTSGTQLPAHSNGLSGGAIAGIVIGSVVFLLLAGLGIWLLRSHRRKKEQAEGSDRPWGEKAELEGHSTRIVAQPPVQNGQARPIAELPDTAVRSTHGKRPREPQVPPAELGT